MRPGAARAGALVGRLDPHSGPSAGLSTSLQLQADRPAQGPRSCQGARSPGQAGRAHAGQDSKSGGSSPSVARGLPTLPRVRCGMHTGSVLGHGLDHIQEEGPLVLLLAPVLEPLLNFLEGRGGRPVTEGTGPKQGAEDPNLDRSGGAGLSEDRGALDAASSAGRRVCGPPLHRPQSRGPAPERTTESVALSGRTRDTASLLPWVEDTRASA